MERRGDIEIVTAKAAQPARTVLIISVFNVPPLRFKVFYGARADFAPTARLSSAEPHLPAREFHENSLSRIDSVVVQRDGSFRNIRGTRRTKCLLTGDATKAGSRIAG